MGTSKWASEFIFRYFVCVSMWGFFFSLFPKVLSTCNVHWLQNYCILLPSTGEVCTWHMWEPSLVSRCLTPFHTPLVHACAMKCGEAFLIGTRKAQFSEAMKRNNKLGGVYYLWKLCHPKYLISNIYFWKFHPQSFFPAVLPILVPELYVISYECH